MHTSATKANALYASPTCVLPGVWGAEIRLSGCWLASVTRPNVKRVHSLGNISTFGLPDRGRVRDKSLHLMHGVW